MELFPSVSEMCPVELAYNIRLCGLYSVYVDVVCVEPCVWVCDITSVQTRYGCTESCRIYSLSVSVYGVWCVCVYSEASGGVRGG